MAPVGNKAIDIANALLDEGYKGGKTLAIVTAKAEEWGKNRGNKFRRETTS